MIFLTAMIDSIGGPTKVNNVLTALNIPTVPNRNLKKWNVELAKVLKKLPIKSAQAAANETLEQEME